MIGIPFEFAPSSLLQYEQIPSVVKTLLENSRISRRDCEWEQAERHALDAREFCRESVDHLGMALAQLHLTDFYCEVGELGWAMEQGTLAYQTLQRQSVRAQRHNEAIAAYALGRLYELQLIGDNMRALSFYQEALQKLEMAQEHWATLDNEAQVETCQKACQVINDLSNRIVKRRTSKNSWQSVFAIWQQDSADAPFAKVSTLQGCITSDNRILINGAAYHIHSGNIPDNNTANANYHFALAVPENQWIVPETRIDDYVFIRQQWFVDEEKVGGVWEPGIMWEPGDGWFAVNFKRGNDGTISFYPLPPAIIGGARPTPGDPVGKVKGYITALLKPE